MNSGDYGSVPTLTLQQSETAILSCSESEASISCSSESSISISGSESSISSSSFDITDLLFKTAELDEDITFHKNGYEKIARECDTLQGSLFKAKVIGSKRNIAVNSLVAIKKIEKSLYNDGIAVQDGMTFCVSEDIIKEAMILKYVTVDNNTNMTRDYMVKYVDFFKCSQYYYLVTEYSNSINLKQFVEYSHKLIKDGRLSFKEYQKAIRYILWQLNTAITWLHNVYHCAHLDIHAENILVENSDYIERHDGTVMINKTVSIKLVDFGVADLFNKTFECQKQGLTIENECYVAPNIYKGRAYDARAADMFTLGLILYQCMAGKPLYTACDMWDSPQNGYYALMKGNLLHFIQLCGLKKRFDKVTFSLLQNLLNVDENKRISSRKVMQHPWFKKYYKKYHKIIAKEMKRDEQLLQNKNKYFPVYSKNNCN